MELDNVAVKVKDQFANFYVDAEIIKLGQSLEEVEHVFDARACKLIILVGLGCRPSGWKLDAIDDAHKAVEDALSKIVVVLLVFNWEALVDRLQTHLTCSN